MSKYNDGEYIQLYFDYDEHPEYIKGWVTLDEAKEIIGKYFGDDKVVKSIDHCYAFWGVGIDDMGNNRQMFIDRYEPGRGRFKVTSCEWEYSTDA